jgi:single-stranded DNA-binding protein
MNGIQAAVQGKLLGGAVRHTTKANQSLLTFGVILNAGDTTSPDERQAEPEWLNITAWGELATVELCTQLFKGREVYVVGRLKAKTWLAADGDAAHTRSGLVLTASEIVPIGFPREPTERTSYRPVAVRSLENVVEGVVQSGSRNGAVATRDKPASATDDGPPF